ncbi:MAG TPA: lamin tail domain-containing protein, partial [Myxococcales bacterium]|nr:lamin tail domain-containing protein [Myxococcales bacterium]
FSTFAPVEINSDNICFAIISKDAQGTASALSNVPLPPIGVTDLNEGDATNDTSADLGFSTPLFQDGTTPAPFKYALAPALDGGCAPFGSDIAAMAGGSLKDIGQLQNGHQLPITGLTPNSVYCVALLSSDTDGDAAWSNVALLQTSDQSAPPPPPNVVVTGTTDTTISIQFSSVVDNGNAGTGVALKYDVNYVTGDCSQFQNPTDVPFDETGKITAAGQPVNVVLTGLTAATQYCFFVNATNAGGTLGIASDFVPAMTQPTGGGGGAAPPAPITDLTARLEDDSLPPGGAGVNQQTAYLKWTAPADSLGNPVKSYTLYSATDEGCPITTANLANATKIPNTLTPIGPGGTEGVEVQVTAIDADDVCFDVTATDAAGKTSALSNVSLPPHMADDLSGTAGEPAESTESLTFTPFFQTGTTQKSAIAFAAVATGDCPLNSSDFFNADTNVTADASGGSALFTGLSGATTYCVGVQLTSNLDDVSFSLAASFTTATPPPPPDETPPGPVVIQTLQPGDATSTGAKLSWVAPADNGIDAASGQVASYSVYYVPITAPGTAGDCDAIDPATAGTPVATQPIPSAAPGATEAATIALAGSDKMPVCIAATATDLAGNTSARQPFKLITDTTAPAQVSPLTAQNITFNSVDLAFSDVGDDGTTGTAASFKVAFAVGACPGTFDFNNATLFPVAAVPQAPGTFEVLTVTGLSYSQTYCFGLSVMDAAGNASPVATAQATTATPDVVGEITQLRADIAEGLPTTNDAVHGALVTYVKAAVGSAAIGTPDGEGFFIQPANTAAATTPTAVPAIFVGADTSAISVGDLVDLTNITGLLAGCTTPPCTSSNGLEIATLGTAPHVASHNAPLPAVPDFSNLTPADWPAPINVGNWPFESNLVSLTGTITSPLSRNGFTGYFLSTAGVVVTGTNATDARFEFRIPTTLATTLGLPTATTAGFNRTVQIKQTPVVRSETAVGAVTVEQVNPSAWVANDVALGPTDSFSPASGTITTTPTITVTYSAAMDPSTVTGQAADGACTGSVQFSKDNFTTCLALSLTPSAGNTIFTLGLAKLADGTAYELKTTSAAKDAANGLGAATASTSYLTPAPATGGVCTAVSPVLISQVYTGGGSGSATVKNDFVELHNRSETDVTVPAGGWSVQYVNATGTTYAVTNIPAASVIPAGGYFLVNESATGSGTAAVAFTGDVLGTLQMASAAGRVALVAGPTALTVAAIGSACPTPGQSVTLGAVTEQVLDIFSYGTVAGCTGSSGAQSATLAAQRSSSGCDDTGVPSADYTVSTNNLPRSSAKLGTPTLFCSCDGITVHAELNGKGAANGEIDLCTIDAPTAVTGTHGATAGPFNGTFVETTLPEGAVVKGQVGYGIAGTDPFTQFAFTAGTAAGNGTDYSASLTAPAAGSYSFLWRFSLDSGSHWTYCDINGAGATAANPFDTANLGTLTSQ